MSSYNINIFISHSWKYSGHYEKLYGWIFNENWRVGQASLNFKNYSVPKDDPIHNADNTKELKKRIYQQIALSSIIIIPNGMYASYSKWIQEEISGSICYGKPILVINPWGQERTSKVVNDNATKVVGWNKESVISGIWDIYKKP